MMASPKGGVRFFRSTGQHPKYRYQNPKTGKLLHFSGDLETDDPTWAWEERRGLANMLKATKMAEGNPWPYVLVEQPLPGGVPEEIS